MRLWREGAALWRPNTLVLSKSHPGRERHDLERHGNRVESAESPVGGAFDAIQGAW